MAERITQSGSAACAAAGGSSSAENDTMPVKVRPAGLSAGSW
jgi:hypothetical protein